MLTNYQTIYQVINNMIRSIIKYYSILFLFSFLFISNGVSAQFDIPEMPPLEEQTSLYDYIDLLTPQQQSDLRSKLIRYSDTTSTQIVVAIISTTNGDDISMVGANWGEKWGIGQADEDNGILILLANEDRTVDINTGYGIEYRITDRMAEKIINNYMIPEFKLGNYYEGLDSGTNIMFQMLQGEFIEEDQTDDSSYLSRNWDGIIILAFVLFFFIMIFIGIIASRKRKKGGFWDTVTHSSSGSYRSYGSGGSSYSGGSSSSSFGGGFGGGSFGGGGASGSW